MRYQALLLLLAAGSANAATLEVAVSQGAHPSVSYSYPLGDQAQTLDLRDSTRYTVGVLDKVRKKEICREAEYRTGMVMSMRSVQALEGGKHKVELIGQVSDLKAIEADGHLSCGTNMVPKIVNSAFSDTTIVEPGKQKAVVVDGKTTLFLTIKE